MIPMHKAGEFVTLWEFVRWLILYTDLTETPPRPFNDERHRSRWSDLIGQQTTNVEAKASAPVKGENPK